MQSPHSSADWQADGSGPHARVDPFPVAASLDVRFSDALPFEICLENFTGTGLISSQVGPMQSQKGMADVTQILTANERGEARAAEDLLPLAYDELRGLAAAQLSRLPPGQTLQAAALVHEAWLRLVGTSPEGNERKWEGRRHFFGAAAQAIRKILIDRARSKSRRRHGGDLIRVDFGRRGFISSSSRTWSAGNLVRANGPGSANLKPWSLRAGK